MSESGVCGLRNLGNTCYMNSALQCLSNIPSMVEFCKDYKNFKNKFNTISTRKSLLELFCDLIDDMWSQQTDCLSPNKFRSKVAEVLPSFAGCGQQDCTEFLRSLLNTFHDELSQMTDADTNSYNNYKTFDEYLYNNFTTKQLIIFSCSECGYRLDETYCPLVVLNLPQIDKKQNLLQIEVSIVVNNTGIEIFRCDTYVLQFTTNKVLVSQLIETLSQRYSDTTSLVLDDKHLIFTVIINHMISKIYDTTDSININELNGKLFVYQFDPSFVNHLFVGLKTNNRFGIPLLLDINDYSNDNIIDTFVAQLAKCLEPDGKQLLTNSLITKSDFQCINFDSNLSVGNQLIFIKLNEHLEKYYTIKQFSHGLDDNNFDRVFKLDDCINQYVSVQHMDDQQNCPNCCTDMFATDCFGQHNHQSQQDSYYPLELDFTNHIRDAKANGAQYVYDLLAITNYTGSYYSGHYTAYARNHINRQWYKFNDSYCRVGVQYM
ncbi:ubiquitin carboxyl-terminal hydrolase 4-like [Oppia nitens]|uniref:ubiquitin carboxyl-terminal hydrolase 4-like n=1 Tax=Oppia nitens TaxID=1686743 RepID=UPI0023DC7083|nr:ubiquitin carboxyl-terminal hydrolase 4-like [Oppia nitens]